MRIRTTSTHRTYRYVRLSIVGATLVLAVSLAIELATGGMLSSVSAAFYTPAGHVFVGSLCAISLALLVLSGRSVEQSLLDIAAVFAVIIALVPTPVTDPTCSGETVCVPEEAGSAFCTASSPSASWGRSWRSWRSSSRAGRAICAWVACR